MSDLFFIYGKAECPFCDKAKELLHSKNLAFGYLDVGTNPTWRDPAWKTVPQVFYGGEHIGGYNALAHYLSEKNL